MTGDEEAREADATTEEAVVPAGLGLGTICGAQTKAGGICTKAGMANGRCRSHGGNAAKGLKSGAFKTGRYSKALKHLDDSIGDRVDDPKLVDPRRSIAVQENALARLSEMLEEGDSPDFRETVRTQFNAAMALMKTDPVDALSMLRRTQALVNRGVDESRALTAMRDSATALNQSQTRYWTMAMNATRAISPEEFIQTMFRMADIIESEVDDADAARRILARTDREICGGALGLGDGKATG